MRICTAWHFIVRNKNGDMIRLYPPGKTLSVLDEKLAVDLIVFHVWVFGSWFGFLK
jgi:hypothetical protein